MWSSVAASGFGDRMMMLAALALMGGLSENVDSASINAGIMFWFFVPYLLFGIPAGWLGDRLPRKWLLLGCDETRAALLLLGFLLVAQAPPGTAAIPESYHWQVLAIIFAVGAMAATFSPIRNAIVPQLVPLRQLQPANAVLIGLGVIANMVGILVGGQIIDPTQASHRTLGPAHRCDALSRLGHILRLP